jgi:ABC-type cobalt transport system substrate-binding protein
MDRFHNKYGTMNSEAQEIISDLEVSIRPIFERYKNDIEAIVFLNKAISFLFAMVSEYTLMYAMKLRKEERKNE